MSFWNEPGGVFTIHLSLCCVQLRVLLVLGKAARCRQEEVRGVENVTYNGSLKEQNLLSLEMSGLQ